ncbi:parasitic phase-specific protein PSP-1 [Pestalotiopsis sp. NC0098]|nr:parasitic phase-specific protein PSP-1 [Pestalotiopsis sp. NC0098]
MASSPSAELQYVKVFGPSANCTLDICPVEMSVYGYRPSLAANFTLLALYVVSALAHTVLGFRWKTYSFMAFMIVGAVNAVLGYAGRIMLYYNPFNFTAFMIQIICITSGPVYYSAAIYITLASSINHYGPELSRVRPALLYWIFIPCDIVCLCFQAAGGGLSTSTSGKSQMGVDNKKLADPVFCVVALVGLSLQVAAMVIFCTLFADYLIRYYRSDLYRSQAGAKLGLRSKLFFGFLALAIVLILTRCAYRLVELKDGYSGRLIRDEGLFIGLEGVMVIAAVFSLTVGHPGFGLRDRSRPREQEAEKTTGDVGSRP